MMKTNEALIIVDYQNDFVDPCGTLTIPGALELKPYILAKIKAFRDQNAVIIATKDWHPKNHCSFKIWPPHAVQNTWGSQLAFPEKLVDYTIHKGFDLQSDSYGAFFDDRGQSNGLDEFLKKHQIHKLTLIGVAINYCVSQTFAQAQKLGYEVVIDSQGVQAIPLPPKDSSIPKSC